MNQATKTKNQVRVVIYVASETDVFESEKYPIPENYMSESKEFPKELLDELKNNGWADKDGVVMFSKDFKPQPVQADDGHVYLCVSHLDGDGI